MTALDDSALLVLRAALVQQARRQLRDEHEAEDVAQDALIAICSAQMTFQDLDHVTAYARRTVHNLCVDRIRRRIRHVALENADAAVDTVEEEVLSRELMAAVAAALAQINPAYAQVLVASSDLGRNHAAIAAATGVSLRNVRHGLDRGVKTLRAQLAAAGHTIGGITLPGAVQAARTFLSRPGRAKGLALGAPALVLPLILVLLPPGSTGGSAPAQAPPTGPLVDPRTIGMDGAIAVGRARSVLRTSALDALDAAFDHDRKKLLSSSKQLHPDECHLVGGHGICKTTPDPSWQYYTVNVPDNPYVPDFQVWGDWMPPCDDTVPANPVLTCEPAHPWPEPSSSPSPAAR
jgi:RNA polymerase sigma-70 factor (ECF subfamily)